jgi:hypothetical protein
MRASRSERDQGAIFSVVAVVPESVRVGEVVVVPLVLVVPLVADHTLQKHQPPGSQSMPGPMRSQKSIIPSHESIGLSESGSHTHPPPLQMKPLEVIASCV